MNSRRPALFRAFALLLAVAAAPLVAHDRQDHDRAREALAAGEILPLRTILERIEREHPGQVMGVELERESSLWIYEIKLLRSGGQLGKLKVDARNGRLIDFRQRHENREGKY